MRRTGGLHLYLVAALLVAGVALAALGLDVAAIDDWLDAHAGLLDAVGARLFRVLCGGVLALCACVVLGGLWQRFAAARGALGNAEDFTPEAAADEAGAPPGWGCMILAVIVGYVAWFGMAG